MERDVYSKIIAKIKELKDYIQGISSDVKFYPDFSSYANRTVVATADTEIPFTEDKYVMIDICGTGDSYAIIYQGEIEVCSVSGAGEHKYVEFPVKKGTTLKTGVNGTYSIQCWKMK